MGAFRRLRYGVGASALIGAVRRTVAGTRGGIGIVSLALAGTHALADTVAAVTGTLRSV